MKRRWNDVNAWIKSDIKRWDSERLRREFLELAAQSDEAVLVDQFSDSLTKDGYFELRLEPYDQLEVGMLVQVGRGLDTGYDGRRGRVCANVEQAHRAYPVRVCFSDDPDDVEVFDYEDLIRVRVTDEAA